MTLNPTSVQASSQISTQNLTQNSTQFMQANIQSLQQQLIQQKQQLTAQRSEEFGFEWEPLNSSVALLHDPLQRNGWSCTGYIGCATKREAQTTLKRLQRRSPQTRYHLRKARRLPSHRWEIKAIDIPPSLLERLIDNSQCCRPVHSA